MKIHVLGVCGTFMAGIATIAKQLGHEVSGSDQNIYPPMSTYLESLNIKLIQSYEASFLEEIRPDLVIIGNALSRGNQSVEYILDKGIEYVSGLKNDVIRIGGDWLQGKRVSHETKD